MNSLPTTPESAVPPASRANASRSWWARIPCKLMLAMIGFSIAVEEFYPFSWFPMFTNLEKKTYYVYVTDGADQKLPMLESFGWTGDRLDNNYKRLLSDNRKRDRETPDAAHVQSAAEAVLMQLQQIDRRRRTPEEARTLKLWRTDLLLSDDQLTATDRVLAEVGPLAERDEKPR